MHIIETEAQDVHTFCDIFAGTGTIAKQALQRFNKVIINDFLFSNNVIYKAFFAQGEFDLQKLKAIADEYNNLNINDIQPNYFSDNYGGKFYTYEVAKVVGHIRQDIENQRKHLTDKEYNILLASLIYCIDRIANTCGHFEAYIKKPIAPQTLIFKLIDAQSFGNVEIFQEDANLLAKRISADVVYIDPPYNSRQYSRFYHLYENLVKWDKPILSGSAMKPPVENMSEYCSSRAPKAFADLVMSLDTRYIAVSYNNTYNSRSSSSKNKITLEQISQTLQGRGKTSVFEHDYQFFNAGKSNLENHKELLFITKVDEK